MSYDLFLVAPADMPTASLLEKLGAILEVSPLAVVLLAQGELSDADYVARVRAVTALAQGAGCAVLLDNRPDLVRTLDADGVHMSTGIKALREALADLKPDLIVGCGDIASRHDAMLRGELDVDYLMFGDRDETPAQAAEMAGWWAETFEVPSVYFATATNDPALTSIGTEFVALSGSAWDDPKALAALAGADI